MSAFLLGCGDDDDISGENLPETITEIVLTFSPIDGGTTEIIRLTDPDADGFPDDFRPEERITLQANTGYTLEIEVKQPDEQGNVIDITNEIANERDDHIFLFIWLGDLFTSPSGNGNADNRMDEMNYEDQDSNGLPFGLRTTWTTRSPTSGEDNFLFRILLMHQPPVGGTAVKTTVSGINDGIRDFNIVWGITIE